MSRCIDLTMHSWHVYGRHLCGRRTLVSDHHSIVHHHRYGPMTLSLCLSTGSHITTPQPSPDVHHQHRHVLNTSHVAPSIALPLHHYKYSKHHHSLRLHHHVIHPNQAPSTATNPARDPAPPSYISQTTPADPTGSSTPATDKVERMGGGIAIVP